MYPHELSAEIKALSPEVEWIIIDEVQKVPKLLDIVHQEIERSSNNKKFALTGSSARKLKRGSANLLAGRAFIYNLFPFTANELNDDFNLQDALEWGTLPKIFDFTTDREKIAFLRSYTQTYLKEEILEEQVIRKLEPFRRFLEVSAQSATTIINYENIGRNVGTTTKTVQSYFQILEDTLIGLILEPFHESVRKRQRTNPKFYFFDTGIQLALSRTLSVPLVKGTYSYGKVFESFIINEIHRLQSYHERDFKLSYLRTKDGAEIDLIIERPGLPRALIEIKSNEHIHESDVQPLSKLAKSISNSQSYCFSLDKVSKKFNNVHVVHWSKGIEELGLN
jgi:uncharacterized protein